ncbi:hypothetical protein QBC45DRAFT_432873 [Copromyces sp. CBS 386.78]|nr:hypothetical protein QBC45DRAFT_432873 [Copromyces sp. CBS 386.78]
MQLTRLQVLAAGLMPAMVSARALSRRAVDCAFATAPDRGATCESFAASWGQSVDELKKLNPGITCPNLDDSKLYCVIGTVTADPTPSSSTSSTTSTTLKTTTTTTTSSTKVSTTSFSSTTAAPAATNSPQMPGIVADCDGFYKVVSGDSCDTIASKNSITTTQFKTWNTEINADCSNLWLDYYVCVHIPGAVTQKPTTTTMATSTSTAAPAATNSPQMPGIVADCDGYHKIVSGDQCDTIATKYGITTDMFLSYNSYVNAQCSNLWLDYYVCVHVTPTPLMPGVVSNCKKYYQIQSGDSCWSIYSGAGITFEQFRQYNTGVDETCSNLWLGYYVCTGV